MKRILSFVLCMALLCGGMTVVAQTPFTLEALSVTYATGAETSNEIKVKGGCDAGTLVLRVFDPTGMLLYLDTATVKESMFEFEPFKLEQPELSNLTVVEDSGNNTYEGIYKFVISDDAQILESSEVKIVYETKSSTGGGGGGGGGGGHTNDKTKDVPEWSTNKDQDPELKWSDDYPAQIDPSDFDGDNKPLWDYIDKITTTTGAAKAIDDITASTSAAALQWETAKNNVALAGELMVSNINKVKVSVGKNNKLALQDNTISAADLSKLEKTMASIEQAISKNKITLNRDMFRELILEVDFSKKTKTTITISKKLIEKLKKVDTLTLKDKNFKVSYTVTELKEMLSDKEEFSFEIDISQLQSTTKKIGINFDIDKVETVKIAFPSLDEDTKYMAIVDENGKPVGGRYNPTTGAIEAKINASGIYQIVNNEKDFSDIKDKSEEMQKSIKILAAKGIIEGTSATQFSPDDTINRAEIAALLLRVLSKVDPNADGGFTDVSQTDWFYGTAGSAQKYGMIVGFEDNTFRGKDVIEKDQILAIASRVLRKEMRYKTPDKINDWLQFKDAAQIEDWAKEEVALAVMANIVTRNQENTIETDEKMNRGDAALIIMRLFYKIW